MYVYVVVRPTRTHTELKGIFSTMEAAEKYAERLDRTYTRGARYVAIKHPVWTSDILDVAEERER